MDDENVLEKLDLKHSCFEKALLLEWRNGKTCCHACFTEYGKVEIFFKNGLYVHYRSLHRRSDFGEETIKKGVELLQDLVATETFNNLKKLSNMRRASVSAF
jgi:hypothetical protein